LTTALPISKISRKPLHTKVLKKDRELTRKKPLEKPPENIPENIPEKK